MRNVLCCIDRGRGSAGEVPLNALAGVEPVKERLAQMLGVKVGLELGRVRAMRTTIYGLALLHL